MTYEFVFDESSMIISPTPSIASQHLEQKFLQRKRKSCNVEGHEDIKRSLIEMKRRESTTGKFRFKVGKIDARFGQVIVVLERIAIYQAKLCSTLTSQVHLSYGPLPVFFLHLLFKCPLFILQATISI